jgi:tryptophan synthase alpha chain
VEVVLMGYLNPIMRMGVGRFAELAGAAGAGGVIVPDLPIEEAVDVRRTLEGEGLCLVDLVAPTSTEARLTAIAQQARGFLYLVSLTGVTGVRSQLSDSLAGYVQQARAVCVAPLYVGFGVSTPEHAAAVAKVADGAVMGSALIRIAQESQGSAEAVERVGAHLRQCRAAMHAAASTTEGVRS